MKDQTKGALMVIGAGCLWGTFGILTKITYANTTVGPISLALYRLVFAIPIFGLLVGIKRYPISMTRRELLLFIGFGFCSLTLEEHRGAPAQPRTTLHQLEYPGWKPISRLLQLILGGKR